MSKHTKIKYVSIEHFETTKALIAECFLRSGRDSVKRCLSVFCVWIVKHFEKHQLLN